MTPARDHDDAEDTWDDQEGDDADDPGDLDDEPTVPCPFCSREILEDSPHCPYCERYISAADHAGPQKPFWIVATALVCLGMAVWWIFAAF